MGQRGGTPGCHGVSGGDSGNRPGDKAETGVQRAWLLPPQMRDNQQQICHHVLEL